MTAFTILASKNGQTITRVRIGPTVCVEKAKTLLQEGWQVHITNAVGHRYGPDEFDQLAAEAHFSEMPILELTGKIRRHEDLLMHPAR